LVIIYQSELEKQKTKLGKYITLYPSGLFHNKQKVPCFFMGIQVISCKGGCRKETLAQTMLKIFNKHNFVA
jgi:hypothetical protein